MFILHPRLEADTHFITKLGICNLYLMDDSRYLWTVLVPALPDLVELHDLDPDDYIDVMTTVRRISEILKTDCEAKKINVGALGNLVPQLHIHILARNERDAAWPGPAWGQGSPVPYSKPAAEILKNRIIHLLSKS